MPEISLEAARAIAMEAHDDQVDKRGVGSMQHIEAVAADLADFEFEVQIAGMLHDAVEDSRLCCGRPRPGMAGRRSCGGCTAARSNISFRDDRDAVGMTEGRVEPCLRLVPDGRVCGVAHRHEADFFVAAWRGNETGQSLVRAERDPLGAGYRMEWE